MSRLVAIDPGVRMCGYARFENKKLNKAGVVKTKKTGSFQLDIIEMATRIDIEVEHRFDCLVIEKMKIYDKLQQKGDPNHLLNIAFLSGFLASFYREVDLIMPTPREWKGTLEKPIHHERIKKACPEAESIAQNTPKTYRHNVYDAIGLGLWALERIT